MSNSVNPTFPEAYDIAGDHSPTTQVFEWSSGTFIANTSPAYLAWIAAGGNVIAGQNFVTNIQNNGSGLYRLTLQNGNAAFVTNDVWVVQNTGTTADGTWAVTTIGANQIDLQGSTFGATGATGVVDRGAYFTTSALLATAIDTYNRGLTNFDGYTSLPLLGGDVTLTVPLAAGANPMRTYMETLFCAAGRSLFLPKALIPGSPPLGKTFVFRAAFAYGVGNSVTLKTASGAVTWGPYEGMLDFRITLRDNSVSLPDGTWIVDVFPLLASQLSYYGGFSSALNLQINASVGSNILTVALKDANTGNDPSPTAPIQIPFRDPTIANGEPIWRQVSAPLSISTVVGATQGTTNGVAFRLWLVAFDNGGTVVLALWQSTTWGVNPVTLNTMDETNVATTVAMSAGATVAGTFYTPAGTTLTSKAFRILGFLEWNAGLATAGSYASGPTKIQLFGPGIKKPGDIVGTKFLLGATTFTTNSSTFTATNLSFSYTPLYPMCLIKVTLAGYIQSSTPATDLVDSAIFAGGAQIASNLVQHNSAAGVSGVSQGASAMTTWDAPNSTASRTYQQRIKNTGGVVNVAAAGTGDTLTVEEYMT